MHRRLQLRSTLACERFEPRQRFLGMNLAERFDGGDTQGGLGIVQYIEQRFDELGIFAADGAEYLERGMAHLGRFAG